VKPSQQTPVAWFFQQLRPVFLSHLMGIGCVVLSSLMYLCDPLLIKFVIDDVLPTKNLRLLVIAAMSLFLTYVCRLSFSAVGSLINFRTVQKLILRIRLTLLEHMNRLCADYHESAPVGEKLFRLEQDVDQVAELGATVVPYGLQTLFNTLFVVGTMLVLNARLTCAALPLIPVFFVARKWFDLRLRETADTAKRQATAESSFLQEHLGSILQLQLLNQQERRTAAFSERAHSRMKAANRLTAVETAFGISCSGAIAIGTVVILGYGGYLVFVGALSVGGLVAFYGYLARLLDPVHAAVGIYSQLNRLTTSIRRIVETLQTVPTVAEVPNPVSLVPALPGDLDMENVSFWYANGRCVLDGLSFSIEAGQKVALVGESGGGKSTVAKLFARLYDVTQGVVRVDGMDIRNISLESLRTKVCYVMQEPILFDLSLKENLLLGNPAADCDALIRALEISELIGLLERHGWDTRIGPRGSLLSGGERQRLALARAVLRQPAIMILDESTSAIDGPTERRILSNLARTLRATTMILISHRLTSLNWVDRIAVLSGGTIQEEGTHTELVCAGGTYSYLYTATNLPN
jgi:ABC-type bacteriocin/lantibiotic exporter with double-glycine peptidase domain